MSKKKHAAIIIIMLADDDFNTRTHIACWFQWLPNILMLAFSHSVRSILLAVVYSIGTFSKIGLIKYILVGNVQKRKKETKPYLFPHFSNVFHLCSLFKLFLDAFSLKLVRKYMYTLWNLWLNLFLQVENDRSIRKICTVRGWYNKVSKDRWKFQDR